MSQRKQRPKIDPYSNDGELLTVLNGVCLGYPSCWTLKVSKGAKIRNQYNQVPHLTNDTDGKLTNSQ